MDLSFIKWWTSINKTIYLQRKDFNILLIYKWHALEIKRLQRSWKKPPNIARRKTMETYTLMLFHTENCIDHWSHINRHMPITFYNIIKYKNSHKYENAHHHSLIQLMRLITHKHRHMPITFYNIIKYKNYHKYENAHYHSWIQLMS